MNSIITIYTFAYNEELMLPYFIAFYRKRFPNCRIVIYDNESTDDTLKIALENYCEVITYSSGNKINDRIRVEIKNNCWKDAKTDWVIVCDADELLDIRESDLLNRTATILHATYYTIVNDDDHLYIDKLSQAVRESVPAKNICFNRTKITEIGYDFGCHSCTPVGEVKYSRRSYPFYHYKFINLRYVVDRYRMYSKSFSNENLINKWRIQYNFSEWKIKRSYKRALKKSQPILTPTF